MVRMLLRPLAAKDIEKKVNLMELSQDTLSECALILNDNKVYLESLLIANSRFLPF